MKVGAVGLNYYTGYKSPNIKSNKVNLLTKPDIVSFRGILSSEPDLSTKFRYGLEALDGQSVMVVTSNEDSSDAMLEFYADKIDIPIMKKYTLQVKGDGLSEANQLRANFAIYKKNWSYWLLSLADNRLSGILVANPKEKFDAKNTVYTGEKKELKNGDAIQTSGAFYGRDDNLIFNKPKRYDISDAERYLKVNIVGNYNELNKKTVAALNKKAGPSNIKKGFFFSDIGGLDNIIETLKKYVIAPINYPKVFENIRLNKGILLWGPPRCGKTLLGKALANESGAKYREYNANEFKTAQVGSSEAAIREVFKKAIADAPSITFIDEIDSIAKIRDGSSNARFDDPMVNQLLGCMSDLEKSKVPAFFIAATNRKDLLEPALIASGRFGLHLEVPMPDENGLKQIFNIHSKDKPIAKDVSVDLLVQKMLENQFNGSDVAEIISDAYFNALERLGMFEKMNNKSFLYGDMQKIFISLADFEKAIQRIAKQKI